MPCLIECVMSQFELQTADLSFNSISFGIIWENGDFIHFNNCNRYSMILCSLKKKKKCRFTILNLIGEVELWNWAIDNNNNKTDWIVSTILHRKFSTISTILTIIWDIAKQHICTITFAHSDINHTWQTSNGGLRFGFGVSQTLASWLRIWFHANEKKKKKKTQPTR